MAPSCWRLLGHMAGVHGLLRKRPSSPHTVPRTVAACAQHRLCASMHLGGAARYGACIISRGHQRQATHWV